MEPVVERDFDLSVERAEVLRLLGASRRGGPRGRKEPAERRGVPERRGGSIEGRSAADAIEKRLSGQSAERIDRTIDRCLESVEQLMSPAGIYLVTSGDSLPRSTLFENLARVAFCVCTIGPDLEREVSRLTGDGDLLSAFVLDAIGSVAAEAAAEHMDGIIQREAAREGLRTSCRASPGYGDWDIREQESIFELVPAGRIGVRLTGSMMMVPRKSVSFAIHIDKNPARMRSENTCRNCERVDCPFRLLE